MSYIMQSRSRTSLTLSTPNVEHKSRISSLHQLTQNLPRTIHQTSKSHYRHIATRQCKGKCSHTDTSLDTFTRSTAHTKTKTPTNRTDQANMGCASSQLSSHASHRPRGGPTHEQPQMSHWDIPVPPKHAEHAKAYYAYVNEQPKPPSPVARGRAANKSAPRAAYDPYDSPYSRAHYGNGKSQTLAHNQYPLEGPYRIEMRDVSPPRNMSELPRRNASHADRDVSPLGTSRFEQPFERLARTYAGKGRGRSAAGATFRNGGIGTWENW